MNTLTAGIAALTDVISSAESVVKALQVMRDTCSEEQWDAFCECEALDKLLSACCDLEFDLEK